MPASQPESADCAALTDLADHLGRREYVTVLVTGDDCTPCLTVTHRHAHLSVDVTVDGGCYRAMPLAEIAPTASTAAAARSIAAALGGSTALIITAEGGR